MRLLRLCLWLLAILPLILVQCLTSARSRMTHVDAIRQHNMSYVDPVEEYKRSATDFLWPVGARKHYPWPILVRRNVPLRILRYCFADPNAKQMLCNTMQDAFKVWADKLGYPAGPLTGHNMAWEEARTDAPPGERRNLFCWLDNENGDRNDQE